MQGMQCTGLIELVAYFGCAGLMGFRPWGLTQQATDDLLTALEPSGLIPYTT